MEKLLKIGNSIFFVLMAFWTYFSIYFLFQYLNVDYTNLTSSQAKLLIAFTILMIIAYHFRKQVGSWIVSFYRLIIVHKALLLLPLCLFQLLILLTSVGLAAADTTIVYNMATDPSFAHTTDYISIYPNNFLLLLWFKLNYFIAGQNLVVLLAFWNVLFIDGAIVLIYLTNKSALGQRVANLSYLMMILILGLSPQYIYTYSDPITLFVLSIFIYMVVRLMKTPNFLGFIIAGLVLAIGYGLRPTVLIFIIAGLISFVYYCLMTKDKKRIKTYLIGITVATLSFLMFNRATHYVLEHQQFVRYEQNMSRTLLYYVDLGLTYSGNIHAEISPEVAAATGDNRNKMAVAEIKHRLKNYNFASFTGHIYYKYYWMVGEGMFGWLQERVLSEQQLQAIPWLQRVQSTKIAQYIRSFIYVEGGRYYLYALGIQIIWIIISLGLLLFCKFYNTKNLYQLWMQITIFGGLLFLFIFEAGRSRYLIQFLPAIITVSSIGWEGFRPNVRPTFTLKSR
ncbi:hypothetical protein ABPH35_02960 [Streptococcus sp. ZJ93]|uniref:hypothetical protein n=1 Tax=Streptococcus handemini TaxID=3161188 RepID=UPI0032F086E7